MVNYDQQNWALLLDYLRGPDPQIPSATRAKLLHDAWNLAYGGELDIATALNMTLFLEQETNLSVWEVMFTMIDHIGRRISGTEAGLKFEVSSIFISLWYVTLLWCVISPSKAVKRWCISLDFSLNPGYRLICLHWAFLISSRYVPQ